MPVIQIGRCAICQRDGVKCRGAGGWLGLRRLSVGLSLARAATYVSGNLKPVRTRCAGACMRHISLERLPRGSVAARGCRDRHWLPGELTVSLYSAQEEKGGMDEAGENKALLIGCVLHTFFRKEMQGRYCEFGFRHSKTQVLDQQSTGFMTRFRTDSEHN